ncbi:antitoxin [uncultured Pseudacidovorax sp.]|uniref:AbrB/MazE/SpoVT family DNA-binding domain-containing protein n=1 Tax=uncultured Pseudacidovorax sp. TaxID=679313 RepID=UPI0025E7FC38|nr:antitoxin [uncultured Pseudacidovorax sp.]
MHTTFLRKVGGSVMMPVPPVLLAQLKLTAGAQVGQAVEDGRLVVTPRSRPRYSLDELLAASDYITPRTAENSEWMGSSAVGRELL